MTNPETATTRASLPALPIPPAPAPSTHVQVKGYTTRDGTVVAPYQRKAPTQTVPRSDIAPGSEGWLVIKYAANDGLVVQYVEDAIYQDAINGAILEAKTYGEFRRLLPDGEWEIVVERLAVPEGWADADEDADEAWYDDPAFDWNTPFDATLVGGFCEGDYPAWAQAEMDNVLPEDLLDKYATSGNSVHNGPYWHIPHESAEALIADLRALGYSVDDGVNYLQGW